MEKILPHEQVLVRLGCSPIHGIGVFAIQDIKAGTNVFVTDDRDITWVAMDDLKHIEDVQSALYRDFAIRRGNELGCPESFNLLTVGWYVNEPRPSEAPNLVATPAFDLIAARDITKGEELTIRYSSFSDANAERLAAENEP